LDYQMNTIEQILLKQKERVLTAPTPLFEATEVIYEAIDARICELVAKTTYNCKYVILMGAVLINSDTDMGSYTSAKRFELIELESGTKRDLMELLTV